jgi:hypothetical protein
MRLFTPAQVAGYLAFVLGVTAFLQRTDRRLKFFNASQSLIYALHFVLLGNLPASASSLISSGRSFLALKCRSMMLAVTIVVVYICAGMRFAKTPGGWLTVVASSVATLAMFTMTGIPLRLVLLGCTAAWLANNILSHSIGGTMLEVSVAVINITTMARMFQAGNGRPSNAAIAARTSSGTRTGFPVE